MPFIICFLLASEVSKRLSVIKATTDSPMSPPHSIPSEMLNSSKSKNSFGATANRFVRVYSNFKLEIYRQDVN